MEVASPQVNAILMNVIMGLDVTCPQDVYLDCNFKKIQSKTLNLEGGGDNCSFFPAGGVWTDGTPFEMSATPMVQIQTNRGLLWVLDDSKVMGDGYNYLIDQCNGCCSDE